MGGKGEEIPRSNLSQGKMGEMLLWDMSQGCTELPEEQFRAPTPQLCFDGSITPLPRGLPWALKHN